MTPRQTPDGAKSQQVKQRRQRANQQEKERRQRANQREKETRKRANQQEKETRKRENQQEMQRVKLERGVTKRARREAFELPPDTAAAVARMLARPQGLPLDEYAQRLLSQHGEDGMTIEVLRRVGMTHRRGVEIGCGANGGNAGVLVAGAAFQALLLDGDAELVEMANRVYADFGARTECQWISRETINDLLAARRFDDDLDYLGIDLDGVDWWIWETLTVRPSLVVCEYNPMYGVEAAVTIPYAADFDRKQRDDTGKFVFPKAYYGASLTAFERLGRHKGYRLVGTAPGSQNAYFVREDLAGGFSEVAVADAWRPMTKGKDPTKISQHHGDRLRRFELEGVEHYFGSRGFPLVQVEAVLAGSSV